MVERSRGVASKISRGVAYLFKKNKVTHIAGSARLAGAGVIQVASEGGPRTVRARHIILATGARARSLPGIELDGERIIAYREAMTLPRRPESMIIVGAGAIGSYLGGHLARVGHDVTLIDPWAAQVEAIRRDGLAVEGPHDPFVARPTAVHVQPRRARRRMGDNERACSTGPRVHWYQP